MRTDSGLLLPAALYFASNLTAMHALSHLRSSIFSAVMNARIVFAALLSMALLKKRVSGEQWRAIVIIVCAASILCLEDAQVGWSVGASMVLFGLLLLNSGDPSYAQKARSIHITPHRTCRPPTAAASM